MEEPLRWQVPPLLCASSTLLTCMVTVPLKGWIKHWLYSASCGNTFGLTQGKLLVVASNVLHMSTEVMGRAVFVSILIFGPKLGNMLTEASPIKTGESTFISSIGDWVSAAVRICSPLSSIGLHYRESSLDPATFFFPDWLGQAVTLDSPSLLGFQKIPRMECQASSRCIPSLWEVQDCPTQ